MPSHLLLALGFLIAMVATAITLGSTAKTEFVKRTSMALAILASAIFVLALYYAVMLAFDHQGFWLITILLCFVDCVFFLGVMIVCNQDMRFENGGIVVKKGGLLYRMIYSEPMGMKKRSGLTLCSISWLGMLVILFYPIIYIVGHQFVAVGALVCFLVAAQNPLLQNKWWHILFVEGYDNKKAWETLYLGPIPFSPLLLIVIMPSLVGAGVYATATMPWMGWWLLPQLSISLVLAMVVLLPLAYIVALLIDRIEIASTGKPLQDWERKTDKVMMIPRAFGELMTIPFLWIAAGIKGCFDPIATLFRTFKKVACPTITVRD